MRRGRAGSQAAVSQAQGSPCCFQSSARRCRSWHHREMTCCRQSGTVTPEVGALWLISFAGGALPRFTWHQLLAAPFLVLKPNARVLLLTPPCHLQGHLGHAQMLCISLHRLFIIFFLLAAAPLLSAPSLCAAHRVGTCAAHTSACNVWPVALPEAKIGSGCTAGSRGQC